MDIFKYIRYPLFVSLVVLSFMQCAGSKKYNTPFAIQVGAVYYQQREISNQDDGSNSLIEITIPIVSKAKNIVIDSVHFRNRQVKLQRFGNNIYVGRFEYRSHDKSDFIMSNKPFAEYGNPLPKIPQNIPFQLEHDACMLVIKKGTKTIYYKISNIHKK